MTYHLVLLCVCSSVPRLFLPIYWHVKQSYPSEDKGNISQLVAWDLVVIGHWCSSLVAHHNFSPKLYILPLKWERHTSLSVNLCQKLLDNDTVKELEGVLRNMRKLRFSYTSGSSSSGILLYLRKSRDHTANIPTLQFLKFTLNDFNKLQAHESQ